MKLDLTKPVTVPKLTGGLKWLITETQAAYGMMTGSGFQIVVNLRMHPTQLEGVNPELFSDWIELKNIPMSLVQQEGE